MVDLLPEPGPGCRDSERQSRISRVPFSRAESYGACPMIFKVTRQLRVIFLASSVAHQGHSTEYLLIVGYSP